MSSTVQRVVKYAAAMNAAAASATIITLYLEGEISRGVAASIALGLAAAAGALAVAVAVRDRRAAARAREIADEPTQALRILPPPVKLGPWSMTYGPRAHPLADTRQLEMWTAMKAEDTTGDITVR